MKKIALLFVCMMSLFAYGQQQTHWQSPNNFSGSVTVQGILVVNGIEYLGESIEIGAFCEGQCRGAGLPYGTMVMGHRLYFINIGGNTDGDLITFRLWDHESNQELEYECQTSITFHDNDNYGQMGNWFQIEFLQNQLQETSLVQGWNWWTPTVEIGLPQLETALDGKGLSIASQNDGTATFVDGTWNGTLNTIAPGLMYRILTNEACDASLTGPAAVGVSVTISQGNNWFGFTGSETVAIATVFGSPFVPTLDDKIVSQNEGFAIYTTSGWQGTLTTLQPGQGYVYVSQSNETKTVVME